MVHLVNGKLGRIPSHPDHFDATALGLPLYSPAIDDVCPEHPESPFFVVNEQCHACWIAQQSHHHCSRPT